MISYTAFGIRKLAIETQRIREQNLLKQAMEPECFYLDGVK
jgi:hypothetical protein